VKDFRSLKVWEKAHSVAMTVYRVTRTFPREELFGLTSQVRRSAVSVPANIAEGCGRGTAGDFVRFLRIAMGSASETEYHLLLAKELELLTPTAHAGLQHELNQVKRMLAALIVKVESDRRPLGH
jgi:four helix bundle protein